MKLATLAARTKSGSGQGLTGINSAAASGLRPSRVSQAAKAMRSRKVDLPAPGSPTKTTQRFSSARWSGTGSWRCIASSPSLGSRSSRPSRSTCSPDFSRCSRANTVVSGVYNSFANAKAPDIDVGRLFAEGGKIRSSVGALRVGGALALPVVDVGHDLARQVIRTVEAYRDDVLLAVDEILTDFLLRLAFQRQFRQIRGKGKRVRCEIQQNGFLGRARRPILPLGVRFLAGFRPIAEAVADEADKQIALLGPGPAERVHIPITRPEILHADALPAVELLDRQERRFPVSTQIGAGGTEECVFGHKRPPPGQLRF